MSAKRLQGRVGQLERGVCLRDEDAFGCGQRGDDERAEAEHGGALEHLAAREHRGESAEVLLLVKLLQTAAYTV